MYLTRLKGKSINETCSLGGALRSVQCVKPEEDHSWPLGGVGIGSANFLFHLVFFPATYFLACERFSVIAVIAGITTIERRFVDLLSHPSLSGNDCRSAVRALGDVAGDHFFLQFWIVGDIAHLEKE